MWTPERRPEDEHASRSFIAGRTSSEVKIPGRPASGAGAVQRNIEIVPERRVMFTSDARSMPVAAIKNRLLQR
jgi:hypothetical protein